MFSLIVDEPSILEEPEFDEIVMEFKDELFTLLAVQELFLVQLFELIHRELVHIGHVLLCEHVYPLR
jgi:hypothetical protein